MAPRPRAGSRFQILGSPSSSPLFAPEARSYAKRGCHDGVRRRPTPQKARNRPPDMTIRSCRVHRSLSPLFSLIAIPTPPRKLTCMTRASSTARRSRLRGRPRLHRHLFQRRVPNSLDEHNNFEYADGASAPDEFSNARSKLAVRGQPRTRRCDTHKPDRK